MTNQLHDRLQRLADQVEVGVDTAAGRDLWTRGRRYQRARRTGTLLIVAVTVLLVAGMATLTWQRSAPPPVPAPADAPAGLPSRIHEPSRWLPGTGEAGPLGQLVAVLPAERGGWTGESTGIVGISAATGEYRFLDLPDRADVTGVALAPDGRHLAYWLTGETTDTPNTNGEYQQVATGVAVYDTATEEVARHQIETAHGIDASILAWVDADTLLIDHLQAVGGDDDSDMDQSSYDDAPALRWDLSDDSPRSWQAVDRRDLSMFGPPAGGRVVATDGDGDIWILGDLPSAMRREVSASGSLDSNTAVDPTGTRVAAVWAGSGRNPAELVVTDLPSRDEPDVLRYLRVPGTKRTMEVLGWTDQRHVAVRHWFERTMTTSVLEVDVATGESADLLELPPDDAGSLVEWATDLLGAPVVDRPAPPTPLGPRATTALLVTTMMGAGIALVLWRRRVRP